MDEESIIIYHANHKFAISFYKMISELLDMGFDKTLTQTNSLACFCNLIENMGVVKGGVLHY